MTWIVSAGFLTLALGLLTACTSVPGGGASQDPPAVNPPVVDSIRDLVMLAPDASFGEIVSLFGPLPESRRPPYPTKHGPFPMPDDRNVLISHVTFDYSGDRWRISVNLLKPDLIGCFPMDDLPEAVGARKARRPYHSESDFYRLAGPHMNTEFKSFRGRFSYVCLERITFQKAD